MQGLTLPANVQDGRDLSKELAIVQKTLESQSQATLQLANQVAALGLTAEHLSSSNSWPCSPAHMPEQVPNSMTMPSREECPQVCLPAHMPEEVPNSTAMPSREECPQAMGAEKSLLAISCEPSRRTYIRTPQQKYRNTFFFQDSQTLKEVIRSTLQSNPYNVENYYKKTGVCQAIARNHIFEVASLTLVISSSLWMAVDLDLNHAVMLHEADIEFQVVANAICFFFTAELIIRVLAFEKMRNTMKDFWCMFDLVLVLFMIVETWVLWCLAAAFNFAVNGSNIRVLSILRMLRLVRILRLAKLFRFMPELLIIVRGIGTALRAISLVFLLLVLIVYMGAVAFRVMFENTTIGNERFQTVSQGMGTLLLDCALSGTKGGPLMREAYQSHLIYSVFIACFSLIANITMMGVLGGLMVQTIKKVAEVEEEEKQIMHTRAIIEDFWLHLEAHEDNEGYISHHEFLNLVSQPQTLQILSQMDVNPEILVSLSDFMFEESKGRLSQEAFGQWVLDLRGTQKSTLKDHYVTRKFIKTKLTQILEAAAKTDDLDIFSV